MDPVLGAAAISGVASLFGGNRRNKQAKRAAQTQMDFQERMSNTAVQRAFKDMKLAGINPILAGGMSASSPGGASPNVEDVVSPAVSSAKHGSRMVEELRVMRAQAAKLAEEGRKAKTDADYSEAYLAAHGISRSKSGSIMIDLDNPGIADKVQAEISSAQSAAALAKFSIPGMENVARFEGSLGADKNWLQFVRQMLMGSGGSLLRRR